jgi:hypothetical protein
VVSQPATVVVYDSGEEIAAIETVGFYTVVNAIKEINDEYFWKQ